MDNAQVEDTQEDRDAAADYLDPTGVDWGACGDIREGRVAHPIVQAFARYRIAAEQRGFQAAKEAAGEIVARKRAASEAATLHSPLINHGIEMACDSIATAISNMEPVK